MAKNQTPSEIADKQIQRLTDSVPAVQRGIDRVTESPTHKAAQNLDKAAANYAEAIRSGKTKERLEAVDLNEWQQKTKAKADRIPTGAAEARDKIVEFQTQRADYQTRIDGILKDMGTRTPGEMDQRMLKQVNEMRKFRFKR